MTKPNYQNRRTLSMLLSVVSGAVLLCAGCGSGKNSTTEPAQKEVAVTQPAPKAAEMPVEKAVEKAPAVAKAPEPAPAPEEKTVKPVAELLASAENLIDVYGIVQESKDGERTLSDEERAAIDTKWTELLTAANSPLTMCDELDVVAFDFTRTGKKGYLHTLSLLFEVKSEFTKDYLISVMGKADASHVEQLPESSQKAGFAAWGFGPNPPTSSWKSEALTIAGKSYLLITRACPQSRDIPYEIQMILYWNDDDGRMVGRYGKQVNLGWVVDLGE